jgi:hypothetical protein
MGRAKAQILLTLDGTGPCCSDLCAAAERLRARITCQPLRPASAKPFHFFQDRSLPFRFGFLSKPVALIRELSSFSFACWSPKSKATAPKDLINGLREQGYVEGRDLDIAYKFADGFLDRLPARLR